MQKQYYYESDSFKKDGIKLLTNNTLDHNANDVLVLFFLELTGALINDSEPNVIHHGGAKIMVDTDKYIRSTDKSVYSMTKEFYNENRYRILESIFSSKAKLFTSELEIFKSLLDEFVEFIDANDNGVKVDSRFAWFPQAIESLNFIKDKKVATINCKDDEIQYSSMQYMAEKSLCWAVIERLIAEAVSINITRRSITEGSPVLILTKRGLSIKEIQNFNILNPDKKITSIVFPYITGGRYIDGWEIEQVANGGCIKLLPKEWLEIAPVGMLYCERDLSRAVFSTQEEATTAAFSLYLK